jgi:WD40 repeat protein
MTRILNTLTHHIEYNSKYGAVTIEYDSLIFWRKNLTVVKAHSGKILGLTSNQSKEKIYTCGIDGLIKEWSFGNMTCTRTLKAHEGRVNCIAVYKNILVSGGKDCCIHMWNLNMPEDKPIKTFNNHTNEIYSISISKKYIVSGGRDCKVVIQKYKNLKNYPPKCIELNTHIGCISISPNNKTILIVECDLLQLWSIIHLYDIETEKLEQIDKSDQMIYTAVFSPDGNTFSYGDGDVLNIWKTDNKTPWHIFSEHRKIITAIVYINEWEILTASFDGYINHNYFGPDMEPDYS